MYTGCSWLKYYYVVIIYINTSCFSQAKKITEHQFDNIPYHGLGKDFSASWWKTLGFQLISMGRQYHNTFFVSNLLCTRGGNFDHSLNGLIQVIYLQLDNQIK